MDPLAGTAVAVLELRGELKYQDSLKCRRLIESAWYQAAWGDRFKLAGDQNAKGRFENDKSDYRLATSVGGAATGEGGDRILVDDPHNVNEAESDNVRRGVLDWWGQVMSTRLNDPKSGAKVIVMQRVHEADLAGHMLEQADTSTCACQRNMRGRRGQLR
jgi:hypothetical protein